MVTHGAMDINPIYYYCRFRRIPHEPGTILLDND